MSRRYGFDYWASLIRTLRTLPAAGDQVDLAHEIDGRPAVYTGTVERLTRSGRVIVTLGRPGNRPPLRVLTDPSKLRGITRRAERQFVEDVEREIAELYGTPHTEGNAA